MMLARRENDAKTNRQEHARKASFQRDNDAIINHPENACEAQSEHEIILAQSNIKKSIGEASSKHCFAHSTVLHQYYCAKKSGRLIQPLIPSSNRASLSKGREKSSCASLSSPGSQTAGV
eukprot:scaffold22313_cov40-Prasinocladus_malaysianus.AAC.2